MKNYDFQRSGLFPIEDLANAIAGASIESRPQILERIEQDWHRALDQIRNKQEPGPECLKSRDMMLGLEFDQALVVLLDSDGFDRQVFVREEIRRWLAANGLHSDYHFNIASNTQEVMSLNSSKLPTVPLQRQAAFGNQILNAIDELGFDPKSLPKNSPGRPGVKAAVRKRLSGGANLNFNFDKAWERLRSLGDIADSGDEYPPNWGTGDTCGVG